MLLIFFFFLDKISQIFLSLALVKSSHLKGLTYYFFTFCINSGFLLTNIFLSNYFCVNLHLIIFHAPAECSCSCIWCPISTTDIVNFILKALTLLIWGQIDHSSNIFPIVFGNWNLYLFLWFLATDFTSNEILCVCIFYEIVIW